ncbi:hypothetical protein ABT294_31960 [Nonomuraea sp. NPDC000554]|uniref:WXG100-like domain-containing protein n=1 Tax=Nonomuraea sp. NPDC000554 TaxID=3154259 RepID=UPI00331A111E
MAVTLPAHLEPAFRLLGVEWLPEDEDGLRTCAAAYRACATSLQSEVHPAANGAVAHAATNNAGDHIDAVQTHWVQYNEPDSGHLDGLAASLHALADAHDLAARLIEIVKVLLRLLATYVFIALAWALATAAISGGLAAVRARATVGIMRGFARRAVATLRRKLERYFGRTLIRAVETRLRRLLGAKPPMFAAAAKTSLFRRALGPAGVLAAAEGVTFLDEERPVRHPHGPPNPPKGVPFNGEYRIGPPQEPGITFDDPWLFDPDAKPTAADYANWYKWRGLAHGEEAMPGWDDAAAALKHYLDGSGTDFEVDYDKAYKEDKSVRESVDRAIRQAQEQAERLSRESGRQEFQMTGQPLKAGVETDNWRGALGRHSIWGSGNVRIDGNQATMDITIHAHDRYNFNKYDDNGVKTGWTNQENGRFEELGWARSYTTRGQLTRTVTWTLPPARGR